MQKPLVNTFENELGLTPTDEDFLSPALKIEPEMGGAEMTARSLSLCSTEEARRLLDSEQAEKLRALPLGVLHESHSERLLVAVAHGAAKEAFEALRFATGREVKIVEVPEQVLPDAIFTAYRRDGAMLQSQLAKLQLDELKQVAKELQNLDSFRSGASASSQFLVALVDYAVARGASDLHITPQIDGCHLKLRINGDVFTHEDPVCSLAAHQQIVSRLKVLARLACDKRMRPQDGAFNIKAHGQEVNLRLSLMPTLHGEKAVLRFAGNESIIPFAQLGFDSRTTAELEHFMQRSEGMVLFAGPTGSGKTTSMYAVLRALSERSMIISSVEDPVERQLPGVAQTALDERNGLNYENCLRSILRQDPDVIMLGEVRDPQSAKMAFQAASTGHLLLATVHARNVFEVFLRLKALQMDQLTIAQVLNLVVCQRLVPELCPSCKVFDLKATNICGADVYRPAGCTKCDHSGYRGMVLVAESLSIKGEISRALLRGETDIFMLKELCRADNYSSVRAALVKLAGEGRIPWSQIEEFGADE